MTTTWRRIAAGVSAVVLLGALAGCGDDDGEHRGKDGHHGDSHMMSSDGPSDTTNSDSAAAEHNEADAMFAMMMVPHHQQALDMAAMLKGRTVPQDFAGLVQQIHDAQAPEIDQMNGWLDAWNVPSMGHMHMDHGGMDGMLSDAEMKRLEQAKGTRFVRLWLKGMIGHHQGAIDMADAELADGINPEARALAKSIKISQAGEIDTMKQMLAAL